MYPELCIPNAPNGVDFCVVIDNQIKYNEVLQREFKNKQDIRIVVSVDMMDTGVDIPEVVNLVFFKKVLSKIKFWQMIGRGTRLCTNLKSVSPSKAFFERMTNDGIRQLYNDKQGFLIFDICNVFPFFKQNVNGRIDKSDATLSLYQKIFMEKVLLYKAMSYNYASLDLADKKFCENLRNELVKEVSNLNRNYIGVIKNLEYVDRYSQVAGWINLNQQQLIEIKKYIAPNVIGVIDLETSRAFDFLCYKFASKRFNPDKDFKKTAKTLYVLASYLVNYKSEVSAVLDHLTTLQYVTSEKFMNDSTVTKVDEVRIELRDLMRYVEKEYLPPIISDFDDMIAKVGDAEEEEIDFKISIDDFKTLEEKVLFLVQENPNIKLVQQIQHMIKPSEEAIEEFKAKVIEIAKTADEYNELFSEDNNLVVFVRRSMELNPLSVNTFIEKEKSYGFNDVQIAYVKELLLFISQNGKFERTDLLREELNFNGIFNSREIGLLIRDIEECF